MKNKKYYITIEEDKASFGTTYKVELEDHYGNYTCVYERSVEEAINYAKNWCKQAEDRQKEKEIMSKAIAECIELDRIAGITSGNRDCLD